MRYYEVEREFLERFLDPETASAITTADARSTGISASRPTISARRSS